MPRVYELPTHLQVEDTLIAGLTARRFLRLIIQENAPKIVHYKSELKNDSELIIKSFNKLAPVVQQAVRDYSKNSKFLNPSDF